MMIQGFIDRINTKTGMGKKGEWTLYSILVKDKWYSAGFDPLPVKEGHYAEFETETNDKGYENVKAGTLRSAVPPKKEQAFAPKSSEKASSSTNQDVISPVQASIAYQNARGNALALVELLLEHDGLPITGAAAKSAQAKRYEEIKAFVDKLTVEFFNDTVSLRLLQSVVDAGAEQEAGVAPQETNTTEDNA
jgi:hypothetical protein